ncbi:MAG: MarR family transcriptional regulator [Catalinimonas sp.]
MSIERDIQQTKRFRTDYQKLMVNLMFTSNRVAYQQGRALKVFDLTLPQYNVLRILRGQHPQPVTVNLIIERMIDKMSNASRIVDRLVKKDLVCRSACPGDRRAVDVLITEAGLKLLADIDGEFEAWEAPYRKRLTAGEAGQLNELLDKMRG